MIDDWDYQRQLKKGQMDEVDAREHIDAINGMQVNQAALDQEALKGENKNLFFWAIFLARFGMNAMGKHFYLFKFEYVIVNPGNG